MPGLAAGIGCRWYIRERYLLVYYSSTQGGATFSILLPLKPKPSASLVSAAPKSFQVPQTFGVWAGW
jgi:hypothetical protein